MGSADSFPDHPPIDIREEWMKKREDQALAEPPMRIEPLMSGASFEMMLIGSAAAKVRGSNVGTLSGSI
jgi:hypothetical protein